MVVTLVLLCDAANVTEDGKLNLLGVFDRITATVCPIPQCRLSSGFPRVPLKPAPNEI